VSVGGVPSGGVSVVGVASHFEPKSGHETPDKYTPRTIAKIKAHKNTRPLIIKAFLSIVNIRGFFKDYGRVKVRK
jgi:hypothetical protein